MQQYQLFIDGEWRDPESGAWIDAVNPYSGQVWGRIPRANAEDVDAAVGAAQRARIAGVPETLNQ